MRSIAGSVPDQLSGVVHEVPLLECEGVTIDFPSADGMITPVSDAGLRVGRQSSLGIVGESGSGKSLTLRSILGVIPAPGRLRSGTIRLRGRDLVGLGAKELRKIRGNEIAMIYQDPSACLNPVLSVGSQLIEMLRAKAGLSRQEARARAVDLLDRVGIVSPRQRLKSYAHELSGGMAQRVMIALAIAAGPDLLLADEPTTALDVGVQDQVLTLLNDLRTDSGMSLIVVSHDIGVIARSCEEVAVMYAGRVLEQGPARSVLDHPKHPYTRMLLDSMPKLGAASRREPLRTIGGQMPDLRDVAEGCPFRTRCPFVEDRCSTLSMILETGAGHVSACPIVKGDA